jgi:hypothetical protein
MTWRHLYENLDRRFAEVQGAIVQRRDELVGQAETELLEHQRKRVRQLNDGLRKITDEANRRVVALLDEYSDLAFGGQWRGKRLAMFEPPYLMKPPLVIEQRRARVAKIDDLTRCAMIRLKQSYKGLLANPDAAEAFEKEDLDAIVNRLMNVMERRELP